MAFDAHSNFGYSNVAAPAPGLAGTQLIVAPGQGALFPAAPFNCTVWPAGVQPTAFNAEIVRVTAIVGDTLTITRTQEGSTVVNIDVGFQIANTTSRKVFTDIEAACVIGAGTQTVTGPFTFVDGNGITFGMDNGSISASVAPAAAGGVAISAGGNSQSTGTITFANSNGITFGLDGAGVMTASHNGITSQSNPLISVSLGTNGSFAATRLVFLNGNGVSWSQFGPSAIMASINTTFSQSNPGFSAIGGSSTFQTLVFSNSHGITFLNDGGTVVASYNPTLSFSTYAASASNGSFTFHTLNFTNAFNVTFGTSAGGIIFASVAGPSAASINVSINGSSNDVTQLVFANSNGVTWGLNGSTVTASVNTAGGAGVPTVSVLAPNQINPNLTGIAFSAFNGRPHYQPFVAPCNVAFSRIQFIGSLSNGWGPASVTTNVSGVATQSIAFGLYSRSVTDSAATNFSNSSVIVSYASVMWTMQWSTSGSSSSKGYTISWQTDSTGGASSSSNSTNSSAFIIPEGFAGRIFFGIPFVSTISAGEWWLARYFRSSQAASGAYGAFIGTGLDIQWNGNSTNWSSLGDNASGGNSDGRNMIMPGQGYGITTNTALPISVDLTNDVRNSNAGQIVQWFCLKP